MITAEYDAATARFDADLCLVAGTVSGAGTQRLRRRAVRIYRNALDAAAGRPDDLRWHVLDLVVDAFVERVRNVPRSREAGAAFARLERLRLCSRAVRSAEPHPRRDELTGHEPSRAAG
jgi:hypothetical protein